MVLRAHRWLLVFLLEHRFWCLTFDLRLLVLSLQRDLLRNGLRRNSSSSTLLQSLDLRIGLGAIPLLQVESSALLSDVMTAIMLRTCR